MTSEMRPAAGRATTPPTGRGPALRDDAAAESDNEPLEDIPKEGVRLRAPRISREEVFSTADALLLEGIRPTIDRVRVRLGRGSPNTINEFMDAWWAKLGSRLRDLPGREFPQVPERVAANLHKLWNDALEAAHDVLAESHGRRDADLTERERSLAAESEQLQRDRQSHGARDAAREEALQLARSQLEESNQRARVVEQALVQRGAELQEMRAERDRQASDLTALHSRLESEQKQAVAERARLQERFESSEGRWLTELDRTRQALKAAEAASRDLRGKLSKLTEERDSAKTHLTQLRGELATAAAVREQLEVRLNTQLPRGSKALGRLRSKPKAKMPAARVR
ncbi:MAG: DNA-binding protein [Steroidobacteraceae bacterium]